MSWYQLHSHLTNILNESQLSSKILFMAQPSISNDIKRDLSTFAFTWNIVRRPIYTFLDLDLNIDDSKLYYRAPREITYYYIESFETVAKETDFSVIPYKSDSTVQDFINHIKKYLLHFNQGQRLRVMRNLGFF